MENFHLSISFGIETMREIPRTAEELIRLSDQKMYKSKRKKNKDGI
ncbi:diguanylate cyclase with GGDEF domain [Mobilisporobacter senegalensis]|uniref:Diguanylate cyclase with GGDEF domain n=1 Tax=Mobilisporobacter senegalensis TaxID=1329262 RepID=A0A3N1XQE4_9FIRM|nr:diguanylate cyclase [Mobilisporobacter senegalensis]ROR28488.1 diguanylate cyclase with GGDEF domain [Mobilisporobacter senegalensis]